MSIYLCIVWLYLTLKSGLLPLLLAKQVYRAFYDDERASERAFIRCKYSKWNSWVVVFVICFFVASLVSSKYETIMANVSNESLISYLMFIHLLWLSCWLGVWMRAAFYICFLSCWCFCRFLWQSHLRHTKERKNRLIRGKSKIDESNASDMSFWHWIGWNPYGAAWTWEGKGTDWGF